MLITNYCEWLHERQNDLMLTSKTIVIKSSTCLLRCHVANKIVIALLYTQSPLDNLKFNSSFAVYNLK